VSGDRGRLGRRSVTAFLILVIVGCSARDPTAEGDGPELPDAVAVGWVGDYFGSGTGLVDGQPFADEDATLRIAFDADSVGLPSCPACVTVSLDSIFSLANVRVGDPVEMALTYDQGPVRHTLELRRLSGAGGPGNAVSARATIGNAGVPTPFFDVTYVLERP
jgi:hypothetical protein